MNTVHNILGSAVAEFSSTENWTVALSDPSQHLTFLAIGLVAAIAVIAIGGMILGQLCLMPTRRCSGGYAISKGRSTGGFWYRPLLHRGRSHLLRLAERRAWSRRAHPAWPARSCGGGVVSFYEPCYYCNDWAPGDDLVMDAHGHCRCSALPGQQMHQLSPERSDEAEQPVRVMRAGVRRGTSSRLRWAWSALRGRGPGLTDYRDR